MLSGPIWPTWLNEVYGRYAYTAPREEERSRISKQLLRALFVCLLGVLGIVIVDIGISWWFQIKSFISLIPLVLLMGSIGAFVSLQSRLQTIPSSGDPVYNILAVRRGETSISFSLISGAIFAFLGFLLFVSDAVDGTLFPLSGNAAPEAARVPNGVKPAHYQGEPFLYYVANMEPDSASDLAKLLVWSFLLGFAERLIPDTLDRLIVRKAGQFLYGPVRAARSRPPSGDPHHGDGSGGGGAG